jgi:hypothetical protein
MGMIEQSEASPFIPVAIVFGCPGVFTVLYGCHGYNEQQTSLQSYEPSEQFPRQL